MGDYFKQFQPQGVSGIIIIAESHLSLHSWPEFSYMALDYFTCGSRIDIDATISYFEDELSPQRVVKSRHARGKELNEKDWIVPQEARAKGRTRWFTEYHWEGEEPENLLLGFKYAIDRELVRVRSQYQDITVVENPVYGRMLFIDGLVMTTEKDEFAYHEMLSHIPLVLHGAPRDVLIIGGGDGGLLREVLRHPMVENVDMVEIDSKVVEVAREHLPAIGSAFEDPRLHLYFEDGAQFINGVRDRYDVILVDSTDPIGPGKVLFQVKFFQDCRQALKDRGIFAAQALSAWLQEKDQLEMFSNLWKVWEIVLPYVATIPTYPGGLWTFAIGSDRPLEPTSFDRPYATRISERCRYYNPDIHCNAFCLPTFLKQRLRVGVPLRH